MPRLTSRTFVILSLSLGLAACGDDETDPEEGHTPSNAALFIDGVEVSDGLLLSAGETVRVEVRFLDDEGDVITGIDDEHHAGLTFTPATLATVASVDGENFQKDVTAQDNSGTGSVMVGYGHDEEADELEFAPIPVTVAVLAGAR